jgi:hypothetical protein
VNDTGSVTEPIAEQVRHMATPPPERGSRAPASSPRGAPQSAPDRPATLAPHLVHPTGDWALWRTMCLPGAGFDLVPQGHRYTTELRVVAVDQKTADQKQEG